MDETTEPKPTRSVTPPAGTEGGVPSNSMLPRTGEAESTEPRRTRSLTPPAGMAGVMSTLSPSSRHGGTANGADAETLEYFGTDTHQSTAHGDPATIGRYRVIRRIGRGGYGQVYLARDDELDRLVAIKVSSPRRPVGSEEVEAYLAEGRALAKLDHPHIVPVYDVGRMDDGRCYVVSKFIEGSDLRVLMRRARPSFRESAELVATVAEALNHAHARGLVHRDVKPSNVLTDAKRTPFLADFGLALREEDYGLNAGRILGTLAYMSPEQARGESHLVDGRADIFSLGVVLYELLTGVRPFVGAHSSDVLRAIATHDPRPPRQRDESIPRELERICLRAIARQPSGRYATAKDFADDLRAFLAGGGMDSSSNPRPSIAGGAATPAQGNHADQPAPRSGASALVPKGLRAFDESDSDFFLALIPGPLDRRGLPQSIGFWKSRLEDVSSANPLRVGVVYGPSGCGKSSLIRAGLMTRLDSSLHKVVITATARSTEATLLNELAPLLDGPPAGLVAALQALRRGMGKVPRVLIVLDQFEQWLHGNKPSGESELVGASDNATGRTWPAC